MEKIALRFDGGHASDGRLHFYEYTRSQYATARFITTIEHFRRTGEIAQRVTRSSYVEIMVETPREGSFLEILSVKAAEAAATSVSVQLGSLLSHLWSRMLPRSERTDSELLQMAKIQLAESQNRVELSRQETERMKIVENIVSKESATAKEALELAREAMNSRNAAYGRVGLLGPRIREIIEELEAEEARGSEIESDRAALEAINPEKLNKLTSRLRPMLPEMALPLKRSAETLAIEGGQEQKPLILLNPINVAGLTETAPEDDTIELEVHVRSYDRDRGVGKISSSDLPRQLNFVVPDLDKPRLLPKILAAMQKQTVIFVCQRYFDKSGQPTSVLLEDVLIEPME